MVALSKLTMASSPWPSCLAASLISLIYSSMLSLPGSKEVLHLSCKCLILRPLVEKYLLMCFVNSSQLPWKLSLSKLWYHSHAKWFSVFEFINVLVFSEVHSFHPVFCCINMSVRPFSWKSFENGRRNLYSGCVVII